jgi:hypothetical protein
MPSGFAAVVVECPSPPNRPPIVGVAWPDDSWPDDSEGLDSVNSVWFDFAKTLPASALKPAAGSFDFLRPEEAEVRIALFEPKVNRPSELAAGDELLELAVSFDGIADADCVGRGLWGTNGDVPARPELSEMSVDLECRIVRLPVLTS